MFVKQTKRTASRRSLFRSDRSGAAAHVIYRIYHGGTHIRAHARTHARHVAQIRTGFTGRTVRAFRVECKYSLSLSVWSSSVSPVRIVLFVSVWCSVFVPFNYAETGRIHESLARRSQRSRPNWTSWPRYPIKHTHIHAGRQSRMHARTPHLHLKC